MLVAVLGDEERARDTLEDIIRQACEGKALQTLSAEGLGAPRISLSWRVAARGREARGPGPGRRFFLIEPLAGPGPPGKQRPNPWDLKYRCLSTPERGGGQTI